MDNEKIERNPAARIRKKAEGGGRVRFLSNAEEKRLRAAIERRFKEFLPHFMLSIHTGMRMSEQYGLSWKQVDFERRQLRLYQTKNGNPRTIPLNVIALAALRELQAGQAGRAGLSFGAHGDSLQGSRGWFSTALDDAKVLDYTWHCNRHTFASRLVMAGVDLRTVAELLGHRTLQMVMRYSHLAPEHQASAVDRLVKFSRDRTDTRIGHRSVRREKVAKHPNT
jgi:integrase